MAVEFVDHPGARAACSASSSVCTSATSTAATSAARGASARFLQDVATDDADDAGLSELEGVWVRAALATSRSTALPSFHDTVELATFCSGVGPRWAERRTQDHLRVGAASPKRSALWVFVDRAGGRPLPLDDEFFDHLRRGRGRAAGAAAVSCTAGLRPA